MALLETDTPETASRRSPFRRLLRDPQAVITTVLLFLVLLVGLLAPFIAQHGPNESSLNAVNADIGAPGYILGGDQSGRDIFSRLLYSIQTAAISAAIGTAMACTVGLAFGLVGGYFGGRLRTAIEWVFNLIMTFPGLLLLIVLMPLTKGDFRITMLIFGVLLSPSIYRIVRNVTAGVKNELYVDAARVSGLSTVRILGRHVMPVVRGPIIISGAFLMGAAINLQSGLAFLGVGSTEVPSFGAMIATGFLNLYVHPLQFLWPALLLGVSTASLVLLGNSLRDALEGARPKAAKLGSVKVREREAAPTRSTEDATHLLQVKDLKMEYPNPSGEPKQVLKGVSLNLKAGETLGLVGESGSGKTQTAFSVLGVLPPEAAITSGSIVLDGRELLGLRERELRGVRGKQIAYIPQEPMSNLDPSFTIGNQLVEGIRTSMGLSRTAAKVRALELMERVGIPNTRRTFDLYPHQISGGMAQRVLIAGAVASRPRVLIADEPTTALDVTIQAEILDLLRDLQQEMGMAILLVTHNFGVVADICDRIAVMRGGLIVEEGDVMQVFHHPQHPYTQKLLSSILDESNLREDPDSLVATGKEQK
ncbi:ABC transporter [Arthrobacter sp. Soil761]|nr:ABC transporter [Arthrobacter sp. Soil761]